MALRSIESDDKNKEGQSAIAGLSPYWQEADKRPKSEWKKWADLFSVAVTAKFSISIQEVLRELGEGETRNKALLNNLEYEVAHRKCVSVLFLSLGSAARKTLADKYPTQKIAEISLRELLEKCDETFRVKRNRTLERFRFLSRKQLQSETLEQFWNSLNGMAAEFEFGKQTESLVHDIFILNMKNLAVQEKLCTEPKNYLDELLQFVIAYEDGLKLQKSMDL